MRMISSVEHVRRTRDKTKTPKKSNRGIKPQLISTKKVKKKKRTICSGEAIDVWDKLRAVGLKNKEKWIMEADIFSFTEVPLQGQSQKGPCEQDF